MPNEKPPVGLILCAKKDHAVAKYALEGLRNKVLAAEYRTALPIERYRYPVRRKTDVLVLKIIGVAAGILAVATPLVIFERYVSRRYGFSFLNKRAFAAPAIAAALLMGGALIPRPHKNLILYHGVLSANAAWRKRAVAYGRNAAPPSDLGPPAADPPTYRRRQWADLMRRAFG